MTGKYDLRNSSLENDASGPVLVRDIRVDIGTANPERYFWDAINDPIVPRIGDGHPVIPGIRVVGHSVSYQSNTQARVLVRYKLPTIEEQPANDQEQATVEITSAVVEEVTQKDALGQPLIVDMLLEQDNGSGDVTVERVEQVAQTAVSVPQQIVRIERKEGRGRLIRRGQDLVGKVNNKFWLGLEARQALCIAVRARSGDSGETYRVSYEFQIAPDGETWDRDLVFIDEETGQIHKQVDFDTFNGINSFKNEPPFSPYRLYPEADFGFLEVGSLVNDL